MPDADTLEAINREQLATATDRLLLRGYGGARQGFARGSQVRIAAPATPVPCATPAPAPGHIVRASGSYRGYPAYERTLPARRTVSPQLFALALIVPTAVGLAISLAALL